MIYRNEYSESWVRVDTDRIVKRYKNKAALYVRPFTQDARVALVEFLEAEGFICKENMIDGRRGIIESVFPLIIELNNKSIWHMGNVTCSAAAASTGTVMSEKEFYLLYSIWKQK